ncbi:MAG TPA: sensor histidine kinase [Steroidobacteraceae bacterium]|nr:sensor histidine kinase [Steroidobacteraceae bacterium]
MATASPLHRYLGAMNLAAYFTWSALMVLLIDSPERLLLHSRAEAVVCLVAFMVVFLVKQAHDEHTGMSTTCGVLLAVEGALALLTNVFWAPFGYAPILVIMFMADCGMVLAPRALALVGVGVNAVFYAIAAGVWQLEGVWRIMLAYLAFQLFATLTAWYARRSQEIAAQLRETNAHLLATRSLLEESARDHERLRLARELHDVAGHKLTALKLNLTALQREGGGAPAVDTAAQLATELLADIRGVVAQIRQHDGMDIRTALAQLIAPLPAPPVIHLDIRDDARVASVAQAEALLRVVQEALTNVVRHAEARNVWVELVRDGAQIKLSVRDDGKASLPLQEGFGLAGMRERVAALAGRLDISRAAQGGVALDIQLPLQA